MYADIGYSEIAREMLAQTQQFWLMMGNFLEAVRVGVERAILLLHQGRTVEAIDVLLQVEADAATSGDWWYVYGKACADISSNEQAISCYHNALEHYSDNVHRMQVWVQLALLNQADYREKLEAVDLTDAVYNLWTYAALVQLLPSRRDEIVRRAQHLIRSRADRIETDSLRKQYLARPDRQAIMNPSQIKKG
jgi:tetratricopeptide (TPR) repeat protein